MNKTISYSFQEFKNFCCEEFLFLTCVSFEERTFTIPRILDKSLMKKGIVFTTNATDKIIKNCDVLLSLFKDKISVKEIVKNAPFSYSQIFNEGIDELINEGRKNLYIDITTFNHEMLLILLKIINRKKDSFNHIKFLYNGAKEYSIGDNKENKWLSKGCKDIRSVLGYPGLLIPKKPICLTVLVGFEHERASGLIERMEPDKIIIGHGKIDSSCVLSEKHIEPMRYFQDVHKSLFASKANMSSFDFSVRDVDATMTIIEEQVINYPDYNHIIVPLNTKTSTLSIGLLALKIPKIQVCYVEPELYNNENYSLPGDTIVEYNMK